MANLVELGFACGGKTLCIGSDGILQVLVVWKESSSNLELEILGFQIWGRTTSCSSFMNNRKPLET